MLTMKSRDNDHKQTEAVVLPTNIESIEFSYDGGRVGVTINGKSVFYSHFGGNDCSVVINKE